MFCLKCNKQLTKQQMTWKAKCCSHSCAASVSNLTRQCKNKAARRNCVNCNTETKNSTYCSMSCSVNYTKKLRDEEVKAGKSLSSSPASIKKYVLSVRGHKCELCHLESWKGQPAPLVLDHINGKPLDSRLENLRLICGNCNMQLPTFAGRNVGKGGGRPTRNQRYQKGQSY